MKKRILSLVLATVMVFGTILSGKAAEMSVYELDPGCGHSAPAGYRFMGTYIGDTQLELEQADNVNKIAKFASKIPGLGIVFGAFSGLYELSKAFEEFEVNGVLKSTYYLYMYQKENHPGEYWYHYVWTYDSDKDGKEDQILTCQIKHFYA